MVKDLLLRGSSGSWNGEITRRGGRRPFRESRCKDGTEVRKDSSASGPEGGGDSHKPGNAGSQWDTEETKKQAGLP